MGIHIKDSKSNTTEILAHPFTAALVTIARKWNCTEDKEKEIMTICRKWMELETIMLK